MTPRLVAASLVLLLFGGAGCALTGNVGGHEVVAYFEDVGDLVPAARVQMLDVQIGLVKDIELVTEGDEMLAKVTVAVDEDQQIPATDLEAVVRQTSLLGEQFVELLPRASGAPYIGDAATTVPVSQTDRRVDIETFLSDLSSFIGNGGLEDLNRFTHAQALILEERGHEFGRTIEELERFTGVLANRRFDLDSALDELASASGTLAGNRDTLIRFLDSFESANALLADQGDELRRVFASLRRFGDVSSRFLVRHQDAIDRQFKALRPVLHAIAIAEDDLRVDITQLRRFVQLFARSIGGGPGGQGKGDYVQVDAVLCELMSACSNDGSRGDVPGEGR